MTDAINMLKTAYKALDDKKAYDIKILDIKKISSIADYMVIADGTNKNQVQAMCDAVTEEMGKAGFLSKSIEGYSEGGWILLDYYDTLLALHLNKPSNLDNHHTSLFLVQLFLFLSLHFHL